MGEDDSAGVEGEGEIDDFFAICVAAEVKAVDTCLDGCSVVEGPEIELRAVASSDELAAGGFWVAVADEAEAVEGGFNEVKGRSIGGSVFDEHTAAENVNGGLFALQGGPFAAGLKRFDLQLFEDFSAESDESRLSGNFVEGVHEGNAEARAENGGVRDAFLFNGLVENGKDFLHSSERKGGDEHGSASVEDVMDFTDEALLFLCRSDFRIAFRVAASGFDDEGINLVFGEARAVEGFLVAEKDISRKEDFSVLVHDLDATGSENVAGWEKSDLEGFLFLFKHDGPVVIHRNEGITEVVDVSWVEQRILLDIMFFALLAHDVVGIVQHARSDDARGVADENLRHWMLFEQKGEGSDVV